MLPSGPRRRHIGSFVPVTGDYVAFVPAVLPPSIFRDTNIAVRLSAAYRSVGMLAGEARHLPNL